ncbi:6444_t:CDS:2, partial [Cetraspora pellucida]
ASNADNYSNAFDLGALKNFFNIKFSNVDNCSNPPDLGSLVNCSNTLGYDNLETFFDNKSGNIDKYTFDFDDSRNFFNSFDPDNLEAYLNAFGPSDIKAFLNTFDPSSLKFTSEMSNEVKFLASCGVCAGAIIEILQKKFTDKYVHERNCKKEEISDASSLYLKLIKKQQADPTFYIDAQFEDVQSTQHIESYNAKIKNYVNELSSILELKQSVEKLLEKESHFVHLNKTMSQLSVNREEQYYNKYFINLENKLEQQVVNELPIGIFSENMFDMIEDVSVLLEPAIVAGLNSQSDEKGFGMMKKTLNLAIMTNRTNEPYKIYENFIKKIELKLIKKNNETEYNDSEEFACTISNPISVRTKSRKSKKIKGFNDNTNISKGKNKKKQILQVEYNKSDNDNDVNYKKGSNVKEKKGVKKCEICNSKGHNACMCLGLAISDSSEDNSENDDSEGDNSERIDSAGNNSEETSIKRKCGICNLKGYNAWTCSNK